MNRKYISTKKSKNQAMLQLSFSSRMMMMEALWMLLTRRLQMISGEAIILKSLSILNLEPLVSLVKCRLEVILREKINLI